MKREEIMAAYQKLKTLGATVTDPVELTSHKELERDGNNALFDIWSKVNDQE